MVTAITATAVFLRVYFQNGLDFNLVGSFVVRRADLFALVEKGIEIVRRRHDRMRYGHARIVSNVVSDDVLSETRRDSV